MYHFCFNVSPITYYILSTKIFILLVTFWMVPTTVLINSVTKWSELKVSVGDCLILMKVSTNIGILKKNIYVCLSVCFFVCVCVRERVSLRTLLSHDCAHLLNSVYC